VPDDPQLFDRLTVQEHFRFIAAAYRLRDWQARGEALLARLELTEKRNVPASDLSRGIRTMKALIREHAATGAAIIVSSHLLSLFEDLITTVLILHHGRVLRHGRLDDLRNELARRHRTDGRPETLEELFFRLTETPAAAGVATPRPEELATNGLFPPDPSSQRDGGSLSGDAARSERAPPTEPSP
jgi:ABC-2 type transport system ATP-binding protein